MIETERRADSFSRCRLVAQAATEQRLLLQLPADAKQQPDLESE